MYCEWPLGRDVAETEELAAAASKAGVHVAIGLQTRTNPAALRARELIAAGAIGRVLSARLYSGPVAFGRKWGAADAYLDNPANGATLVTIHGGHPLDLVCAVLGGFEHALPHWPRLSTRTIEVRPTRASGRCARSPTICSCRRDWPAVERSRLLGSGRLRTGGDSLSGLSWPASPASCRGKGARPSAWQAGCLRLLLKRRRGLPVYEGEVAANAGLLRYRGRSVRSP